MRCIIVDDDEMSRKVVARFVEQTDFLELIKVCSTAIEAANLLEKDNNIDLILLDIEMPEMSGIDLMKSISNLPQVILITSKKEYAVEAFEYDVTDYIVKPLEYTRFLKAVSKAKEIHVNQEQAGSKDEIFIKVESRLIKINKNNICFVEALGDYVIINTHQEKLTIHSTMKDIEKKLPKNDFIRVHRSFIVRKDKINTIEGNILEINKKLIPIGKSYKDELMQQLSFM